ncbi:MAG: sulfotransferase [Chloroflexi bacterium]|nr:sulfotransferase [Chloroflexota bacterium]
MDRYVSKNFYQFARLTYPLRGLVAFLTRGMLALRRRKLILVFGLSRSGTTMLGRFLTLDASAAYIHEPDTELMKFRFGQERLSDQVGFWKFVYSEEQKAFRVHGLVCATLLAALRSPRAVRMICIKPISLTDVMKEAGGALSNAEILYICRHPAGRSDSIVRQRKHDQNVDTTSLEYFEMLGQAWGRTTSQIQALFREHPDWHWVSFEALANQPVQEFKQLYERLGLTWNERIESEIRQKTTGGDGGFYDVQRDASKQADKWRDSLSMEQVEAIRRGCLPFETKLYEGF